MQEKLRNANQAPEMWAWGVGIVLMLPLHIASTLHLLGLRVTYLIGFGGDHSAGGRDHECFFLPESLFLVW